MVHKFPRTTKSSMQRRQPLAEACYASGSAGMHESAQHDRHMLQPLLQSTYNPWSHRYCISANTNVLATVILCRRSTSRRSRKTSSVSCCVLRRRSSAFSQCRWSLGSSWRWSMPPVALWAQQQVSGTTWVVRQPPCSRSLNLCRCRQTGLCTRHPQHSSRSSSSRFYLVEWKACLCEQCVAVALA